jgi:hypothetical protein
MKQKSGIQMNGSNNKLPSKRRRFIFILLYIFIVICIVTGVADLILLVKSIVGHVSIGDSRHNRMTSNNYTKEIAISIAATERFKELRNNNVGTMQQSSIQQQEHDAVDRCAINFFGLPRAFESLVLPSIIKHIIIPNHNCDYYVHYYYMTEELQGRSGNGGTIDPTAILLLRDAVHKVSIDRGDKVLPIVEFVFDKEEDFWNKYTNLIHRIRTTIVNGKYLYFPWKAKTYRHPVTTDNIIKMWHSIQSAYQLMEDVAKQKNINYNTVAMLRSDVVYVTPINIHDAPITENKLQLTPVTIPNFGKHPVSDRIIYGPKDAVQIWATQRFINLERHVDFILHNDPGWGLHSERFVNYTLFPLIRNITSIHLHPTLCFFRARADESVWVSDCYGATNDVAASSIMENFQGRTLRTIVQDAIGRSCSGKKPIQLTKSVRSLACSKVKITD